MVKTAVARSSELNAGQAGATAAAESLKKLGDNADLLIVFSAVNYNQKELIQGIRSVTKDIPLVGCSDFGEITTEGPSAKSVAVMAIKTDQIQFTLGVGHGTGESSFQAGKEVAEQVKNNAKAPLSLFLMFLDGLAENGADAVRGVQSVLGKNFPIIGGSAGDDFQFKQTFEYYNNEVLSNSIVGVGFSGSFSFGVGVRHGWEPIGLPMKVTKSQGGKLLEVDNRPALSIYEDYFGKKAEELIKEPIGRMAYTYPLGMSVEGSSELLIRDVVIANEKGEISCAAEIPQGSAIRLMLGDVDKAFQAAKEAATQAKEALKGAELKAIFIFDCVARHKLLGSQVGEEIKAVQGVLGKDVPLIGFYTYGEQAPLGGVLGPTCCSVFHNETMALLAMEE